MKRWFAFLDTGRIVEVGEFDSFDKADEVAPGNSVWIFDQTDLELVRDDIYKLLGD